MIRINLLPPEITEKRKFEQRLVWVFAAGLLVFVVLVLVWSFLAYQLSQKNSVLQLNLDAANQVRSQAETFKVFELKESELEARKQTAAMALSQRVEWGRLVNELSLVLPSDAWLTQLDGSEVDGLSMLGQVLDSPDDVPDAGHKAVAKTLVRLSSLDLLYNVWLENSLKTVNTEADEPIIEFEMSAKVIRPEPVASTTTTNVPAPPTTPAP
ncbi:MAG: hypothetical protein Q7V14_04585 [Coriobacteriia bacterium]|nr:hypothetical protein [Coriobacteriia bacterium]MDO9107529.1 hypothetical protein [Coriobacteriia bacterium]